MQILKWLGALNPKTAAVWFVVIAILVVAFMPVGGCEWNPRSAAYDGVPRTREELAAAVAAERERVKREEDLKVAEAKAQHAEAQVVARAETDRLTREAEARTRAAQREYAAALKKVAVQSESARVDLQSRLDENTDNAQTEQAEGLARVKVEDEAATALVNAKLRGIAAMREKALTDSSARADAALAEISRKEENQAVLGALLNSAPVQAAAGTVPDGRSMLEIAALLLGGSAVTRVITRKQADAAWDEAEKKTEAKAKEVKEAEDRGWDQASANNNLGSVLAALIPVLVKATNLNASTVATPPIVAAPTDATKTDDAAASRV